MRPKPYRLFICLCTFSSMYLWQGFHLAGPKFLSFWFMSLSVKMLSTLGNSCANSHIAANNRNSLNVVFFHLFELAVWVYIYFLCTVNIVLMTFFPVISTCFLGSPLSSVCLKKLLLKSCSEKEAYIHFENLICLFSQVCDPITFL